MATASNMRWSDEDIAEARESMEASEREYLRRLNLCTCPHPLPARCYLGEWACALCGKVTGIGPRGRSTRTGRRALGARGGTRGEGGSNLYSLTLQPPTQTLKHANRGPVQEKFGRDHDE